MTKKEALARMDDYIDCSLEAWVEGECEEAKESADLAKMWLEKSKNLQD